MSEYRRPALPVEVYLDDQGRPIEYGDRWSLGDAPEEAYSRVSNPQRFAPLHSVALALISWLVETFDVTVDDRPETAEDVFGSPEQVARSVQITPREPTAAPITFVLSTFPGVFLHAGALNDFQFPDCGCDACDEDLEYLAEELEWTVRTIVGGGYSEKIGFWVEFKLEEPEVGMRSGQGRARDLPDGRMKTARRMLPPCGLWKPWPVRGPSTAGGVPRPASVDA
ncbi:DUF6226 family protein [Glaciihabitans sp. dw_435]|uniref:DUF6226 family protein n=1 Tax=Glaciihabitans sp. dw_435 TaxID=2720081 RepID=UPI001BD4F19E|nr:DUF6226 family protein [Glaciihabitans sp. dw_435]